MLGQGQTLAAVSTRDPRPDCSVFRGWSDRMCHNPQHRESALFIQHPQMCGGPVGSTSDFHFDLEGKAGWEVVRSVWPAAALVLGC